MKKPVSGNRSGFSLVEVSLAIAIAALGLVSILGLLPQGLEMSRKTGVVSAQRHIVEQIIRNLEQTKWSELIQGSTIQKFDYEGSPLTNDKDLLSYLASVEIPDLDAQLPKGDTTGTATTEKYIRRITIKVATATNSDFDFTSDNYRNYTIFYHYLAKGR